MQPHEAIDILKSLNNGYSFSDCEVCENYNELTGTCDKEKCDELIAIETVIAELDRLQKENKYLKEENKELEKMVELMAEEIDEIDRGYNDYCDTKTECDENCKKCIKEYFKKKASEENE